MSEQYLNHLQYEYGAMNGDDIKAKDWQDAYMCQDACNSSGLIHSLFEINKRVFSDANKRGEGTEWRNKHPIIILFIEKLASLCGVHMGLSIEQYGDLVTFCKKQEFKATHGIDINKPQDKTKYDEQ